MRRPRVVVVGLLSAAVVVAGAVSVPMSIVNSRSADAAAGPAEGELLPPLWDDQAHPFPVPEASSSYFAYRPDAWSGERDKSKRLFKTADGTMVSTQQGQVVGPYLVQSGQIGDTSYRLDYLDPVTSEPRGTVITSSFPTCVHPLGVLTRPYVGGGQLQILQRDGSQRDVPGVATSGAYECVDMDDRFVLLRSPDGLRIIDVQTGEARLLTTTSPEWAALTPGRVIWRTGTTSTTEGTVQHLEWTDRNDQQTGAVDLPFAETPQTLGDDLLVLHKPAGGTDFRLQARRITVTDGSIGAPLLTDVRGGISLEDGSFLLARPTAIAVVSPDETVRELMQLPRARERAWGVAMSGDRVVASWNDNLISEKTNFRMADIDTAAGSGWTEPGTTIAGLQSSTERIQLGGDVLVTRPSKLPTDTVEPNYVLEWPGGRREIRQYAHEVKLGRGGRLIAYHPLAGEGYVVEDARTGERFGTVNDLRHTALDNTWVWQGPDSAGLLRGRDVTTGRLKEVKTTMHTTPAPCSSSTELSVVGRWAMWCGVVVDLIGVLPDRRPAVDRWTWVLGNGFVASARLSDGTRREVVVTDLNDPAAPQRIYGPASDELGRDGRGPIAVDDTGAPRFAYVDLEEQVRVVDLDWLHEAPPTTRPDTTAPALTSATAGPRLSPTRSLAFGYTFADASPGEVEPASGLSSYDVRIQQRSSSTSSYGAWRQPWSGIAATRVTMTAAPGVDTCFQVRARDKRGNVSAWSGSRCAVVDGTKPTLVSRSAGDRVRLSSSVKFSYTFKDNGALNTYDVAYRTAPAGRLLGGWVYLAGWQNIRSTSVSLTVSAGSDTCFMVRARDAAGNTTPWSPSSCTSLPLDDRALTAVGSVTRTTTSLAFQGTASRLNKSSAGLTRSAQVGTRVVVFALTGPGQGVVEVSHGGRKLTRISLAATNWSRRVYYLPVTAYLSGTLSVVSVGTAPSSIDAITVLRY